MSRELDTFERERPRLKRLAYRMLGSVAEAEDVVQDAWLRLSAGDRGGVEDLDAWLTRVVSRLALDRLRSAQSRRETYVGAWLPEPWIEPADAPIDPVERAEDVTIAFLLALERLSPLERAVFLLREAFDEDYGAVALALGRSEASVRQLAARARAHMQAGRPRYAADPAQAERLSAAFFQAAASGDVLALTALLADDVVFVSDGGGRRLAALNAVHGRERVSRLLEGLARKFRPSPSAVRPVRINGLPGVWVEDAEGGQAWALEIDAAGEITAIYGVLNPEKLSRAAPPGCTPA